MSSGKEEEATWSMEVVGRAANRGALWIARGEDLKLAVKEVLSRGKAEKRRPWKTQAPVAAMEKRGSGKKRKGKKKLKRCPESGSR